MKKTRIALVTGHAHDKMGAKTKKFNINEWSLNKTLIAMILPHLDSELIEPVLIDRDKGKGGYNKLPKKINKQKPDYILEFHDNSSVVNTNSVAEDEVWKVPKGNEVLYYVGSSRSKELAKIMNNTLYSTLGIKDRGLKAIHTSKENGFHLLKHTAAPCVIIEPAFFSNDYDTENLMINFGALAINIANALNTFVREK